MCWSETASIAFVGIGGVATGLTYSRGQPKAVWLTLGYFTVMEGLQAAGYAVIDQCGTPANRVVTILSYLHIVFQPFFVNALAMELVPRPIKMKVRAWVFGLCTAHAAFMLSQLIPLDWAGTCIPGSSLCGSDWCTRSGEWHLAWDVPYNGLATPVEAILGAGFAFPSYAVAFFILPLFYGAWRLILLQFLAGPFLASYLTSDPGETAAVWCLFSIVLCFLAISRRLYGWTSQDTFYGRNVG